MMRSNGAGPEKQKGKAWICVKLTKLNKSANRERYILPSLNEVTSKVSGAGDVLISGCC